MTKNTWTDDYGVTIKNVHGKDECRTPGACTIHSPSNHHMLHFPQSWRADRGFMERICEHGIGHPDPDEGLEGVYAMHGCDGCCAEPQPEAVFGAGQPVDAEKLFTMDEFDKGTLKQFERGVYAGMEMCSEVFHAQIGDVMRSISDVHAIYTVGLVGPEDVEFIRQLKVASNALDVLMDSFDGAYFGRLAEFKDEGSGSSTWF